MEGVIILFAFVGFFVGIIMLLVRLNKRHIEKRNRMLFVGGFRDNSDPALREKFSQTLGKLNKSMWFKDIGGSKLWYLLRDNNESADTPFLFFEPKDGPSIHRLPVQETVFAQSSDHFLVRGVIKALSFLSGQKYTLEAPFPYTNKCRAIGAAQHWSGDLHEDFWKELVRHPDMALSFNRLGVRFDFYPTNREGQKLDLLDKPRLESAERVIRVMMRGH